MAFRKSRWSAAVCMAALYCSTSAFGQDSGQVGIVRITDGKSRLNVKAASFHGHHAATVNGVCETGGCPDGVYGGDSCYSCRPGCPQCFNGLFQERYCKNSPDHGYSPPAKYPLHRRGVEYTQYFPYQWYGTPGASYQAAPMVYQPTDTTQLGYYYQHVPFWQPNPARMPQRPIPAQWHITAPPAYASSFHGGFGGCKTCRPGYGGYGQFDGGCPVEGYPVHGGSGFQTPTPVNQSGAPQTLPGDHPGAPQTIPSVPTETAVPVPTESAPPPPQVPNSAASGHIRRASY